MLPQINQGWRQLFYTSTVMVMTDECMCKHAQVRGGSWASLVPGAEERRKGAPGIQCMCMCVNFQNHTTNGHLHYTSFCQLSQFYVNKS